MRYIFLILCITLVGLCSCQKGDNGSSNPPQEEEETTDSYFPQENDGSQFLEGEEVEKFRSVLLKADPNQFLDSKVLNISTSEFEEMEQYVSEVLLKNSSDHLKTIFDWVFDDYKHNASKPEDIAELNPYKLFKAWRDNDYSVLAVCQGYANLLRALCIAAKIPAIGVNGWLQGQGHAWLYACYEGKWYVCDALNGLFYDIDDIADYKDMLVVTSTDLPLFVDEDFSYIYNQGLAICEVKKNEQILTIPNSYKQIKITGLVLTSNFPDGVQELYFGSAVNNFGGPKADALKQFTQNVSAIYISEANKSFQTEEGIVYRKDFNASFPYCIPAGMKVVKLKSIKKVAKGLVSGDNLYYQNAVEEIYFKGTEEIEDYAVERCPNLKKVYVPQGTRIAENAFPAGIEVIYN